MCTEKLSQMMVIVSLGGLGVEGDEGKTDIHSNTCVPENFT